MFVEMLSNEERRVFGLLALAVVGADGSLHAKEAAALEHLGIVVEDDASLATGSVEIPDDQFASEAARAAALLELCRLAASDGQVTVEEREVVDGVAVTFGADAAIVDDYLAYAAELVQLLDRGIVMISEGVS